MTPIRIFIGRDHVEEVSYHVLCASIMRYATVPVSITPISMDHFREFFHRERDPKQSNEFSFSRFLVPYLCNYEGWAIFMDCDMLMRCDINDLWKMRDDQYAVMCAQHDYTPKDQIKYLGNRQYAYPRKNWSSLMLMNCGKCRQLTPEYVEQASGLELHRMYWADEMIGSLPLRYNWLVGEYLYSRAAKIVHYTVGGPWFPEYEDCDYADEWRENFDYAIYRELHDRQTQEHRARAQPAG